MKKCKKITAILLSVLLAVGMMAIPAAADTSETVVTKKVSLLDFTGCSGDLTKSTFLNTPANLKWHSLDDYDNGIRQIITLDDGSKALKLCFNEQVTWSGTNRYPDAVKNYGLSLSVPAAYAPYIKSVSMVTDNQARATNWSNKGVYYRLSPFDGTNYGINNDQGERLTTLGVATTTLAITDLWKKTNIAGYQSTSGTKWTDSDKAGINSFILTFTVPDQIETDKYILLKDVSIELSCTVAQWEAAQASAKETAGIIDTFESGVSSSYITGSRNVVCDDNAADANFFAAEGNYAMSFLRQSGTAIYDRNVKVLLDSRINVYDGLTFYFYSPDLDVTTAGIQCRIFQSGTNIANKWFDIQRTDDYIKYTIWFDNVGNPGDWGSKSTTGKSLAEIKGTLTYVDFRLAFTSGKHYYFDNFSYVKRNHENNRDGVIDLSTAAVTLDGYTDSEQAVVSSEKISYSLDGTRNAATWQGYKTAFTLGENQMLDVTGLSVSVNNPSSVKVQICVAMKGTADDGKAWFWKWGENPDSMFVNAGADKTESLIYGSWMYGSAGWGIHNYGNSADSPTGSENKNMQELLIYVWVPAGAAENDYVELTGITLNYTGNCVKQTAGVTNGKVYMQDSGRVLTGETATVSVIPDAGYIYVPDSLLITDSTGNSIDTIRDGFRKTNSGSTYTFEMPAADVSVYAEFSNAQKYWYKADTTDSANDSIKSAFSFPLKAGGFVNADGNVCKPISFGALVTSVEVLDKYDLYEMQVEFFNTAHHAVGAVENVQISADTGYYHDISSSLASFNITINDLAENRRDTEFAIRPYVVYEDAFGNTVYQYGDFDIVTYSDIEYGVAVSAGYSLNSGINISGAFDNTSYDNNFALFNNNSSQKAETYQAICGSGFDNVRLPIHFASHTDENNVLDSEYMTYVDNAVRLALKNNLTVVLDIHHYDAINSDFAGEKEKFYSIWEQLANRYKDYPDRLVFELINEPVDANSDNAGLNITNLNELQLTAIDKIRAIDSNRAIAVTTAPYGGSYAVNTGLLLPEDKTNIILSVHNYDVMAFTHQGLTGYTLGIDFDDTVKAAIAQNLTKAAAYGTANNIPVWVSEFGIYMGGMDTSETDAFDSTDVTAYLEYITTTCKNLGIGWSMWEYNQGFGAFDSNNQLKDYVADGLVLQ